MLTAESHQDYYGALCDAARPIPGEPLRFLVRSRRPWLAPYVVDLDEYRFNGSCHCEYFYFRLRPLLDCGVAPGPTLRCWHINVARQRFLEDHLRLMAAMVAGHPLKCPMHCCPLHATCRLNDARGKEVTTT